jgi:NADPH-dependent glutamate synthase beta subunit-like oxidoreductase
MSKSGPFAITLGMGSSLANHTGTWRAERPVYTDGMPPCTNACPAGEQVQQWLYAAEDGNYETAWRMLVEHNPFPAIMGRICYHPCETACNRAQLDSAVGINSIERFLGDIAIREGWRLPEPAPDTGYRVLVVGAGPAGLSAAYQLRRAGHAVDLHEATGSLGGMMRHGIPTFRLPRDVLDAEIDRLAQLGIRTRVDTSDDDLGAIWAAGEYDAMLLATGAPLAHRAYLPAAQGAHMLDALALLGDVAAGERPRLGRRVVVYGGGNTAMDAARTARRLGATDAIVVYRRTQALMPADRTEFEEAVAEGVRVRWLSTITQVDNESLTVERMRIDEDGRPQPTGEFETLAAEAVVLAIGQDVDAERLHTLPGLHIEDGLVEIGPSLMTSVPGVFGAGDVASAARSVTAAIGRGAQAARSIGLWLRTDTPAAPSEPSDPVPFEKLNTWYFTDAPHAVRPRLDSARRVDDFAEVVHGLDADTALYEARRCLSCGNCFGCDNCYGVCPDNAVHKLSAPKDGRLYEIDYDYCKGCGMCVVECPSGAIVMENEPT